MFRETSTLQVKGSIMFRETSTLHEKGQALSFYTVHGPFEASIFFSWKRL